MKHLLTAALLSLTTFSAAAADTYVIDKTHTFPTFEISHLGFSTFRGRFDSTEGTIKFDAAKQTVDADVTIAVNSISTGVAKLDEHLKAADFFDAAKYPTITFKSTGARFDEDKLVELKGNLTLHGVTKPVTLSVQSFHCAVHPMMKIPACGADVHTTIKRSDWGISAYVPNVGDEVRLAIEIEAHNKAQ